MKKVLVSLLIGVSCFSFAGCSTNVSVEDGHVYVTKSYDKVEDIIENEISQDELFDIIETYYHDAENNGTEIAWSNFKVGVLASIDDEKNIETMSKYLDLLEMVGGADTMNQFIDDNQIESYMEQNDGQLPSALIRDMTQGQQ